jgi:hypothetical protein
MAAAFLGASLVSSPAAEPSSFVLLDQVVTHTGNQQLYQNWDFNMGHKTPATAPTNWLAPESPLFDHGIYHWRVEVRRMERPWASPMSVQFGWWNITGDPEIRHIASPLLILTNLTPPAPGQPWVYEQVGTVKSLDRRHMYYGKGPDADKNALDWDWRRAFAPNSGYTLLNPLENKLDRDGDGKITEAEYPDLEYRSVLTIHGPGSPLYESLNPDAGRMTAGGGFELQTLDTTIVNPWLKTVGDVDGDGRTDIVVGGAIRGGLVVYLNRFPAWERQVVDASRKFSTDGEVVDLDGDGRNDIVAITIGPDTITWYRNTGSGWTPQVVSDTTVHDVEVADFDGDGRPDIVARNQKEWPAGDDAGQRLHFFWQKRAGSNLSWESSTLDCPPGEGLLATDLDGDGRTDIVVNGVWFENLGQRRWKKHTFAKAEDWSHANTFIATGDFNGDGRRDLVLAPSELKGHRYRITWFEAPADPRTDGWRAHVVVPDVETVCHFVGAADFDGDGRTDIAYAHMPQGADPDNVRVLFNRGHQDGAQWRDAWEPLTLSEAGSHSMRVLDADGDGRPDLFGANWRAEGRDEHVKLWLNRLHTGKPAQARPLDR